VHQGVNVDLKIKEGSFDFVDASAIAPDSPLSLKQIFERVKATIESPSEEKVGPNLVVVDELSVLEWIGLPASELLRFARALAALCLQVRRCGPCLVPRKVHGRHSTRHRSSSGTASLCRTSRTTSSALCSSCARTTSKFVRSRAGRAVRSAAR
jgi:hypothetical protein